MKNVVIAVLMLVGVSGLAQEKERAQKRNRDRVELTPEQRNELRLKEMTLKLDLNASQQKEVAKIISEQQAKRTAAREEMKARQDKNAKLSADEVYARKNKMLDEQIAMKEKMKKVLNESQFEKWEKMNEHKQERFKKSIGKRREKMPEPQD